jgi:tRNA-dihydrouridine synthase C
MPIQVDKIILAPMEGVLDPLMRGLICSINKYDLCITEFIRIVDQLLPSHVFHRICPELNNNSLTNCNTPVRIQLLGQEPDWMAENAVRAVELGSQGIDINFGCPAKMVNKNRGGAVLLKDPEQIFKIVSNVKSSVGESHCVSAKIRLGFDDVSLLDEIVSAIETAGADLLTIHARTKKDGYRPPAHWHFINDMIDKYNIDIVANGEIWDKQSAQLCIDASGAKNLMLGRGALALPNLANVIRFNESTMSWSELCSLLRRYSVLELQGDKAYYFSSRLKQWLRYLKLHFQEAEILFNDIKTLKSKNEILSFIDK